MIKPFIPLALVLPMLGCAIAFTPSDKGINSNIATRKNTVAIVNDKDSNPSCHDNSLLMELEKRFSALGYTVVEDDSEPDLELHLKSDCSLNQRGSDDATAILPLASFFILPITATTEYHIRVQAYEYGNLAKEFHIDGSSKILTHPFYFERLKEKHKEYVDDSTPAISRQISNSLQQDHFL